VAKAKLPTIVSPVGTLAYSWLAKPDEGKKYSDGKYKGTLVLDPTAEGVKEFIDKIDKAHVEARGKKKTDSPVKDGNDKIDRETGEIREEFKDKVLLTFKSKFPPQLLSRDGPLPEGREPRAGDLVKIAFAMLAYEEGKNAGISLQMRAVKLMERRARADYSDAFGDDDEDGESSETTGEEKSAPTGKKASGKSDDF
jgi:hypothetical protein